MSSCSEQKAKKREEWSPSHAFGLLWPSLPTQKVDAEIIVYRGEGVNLVKLHLAGQAHSVREVVGARGLAYEWAEKWLVVSHSPYWEEIEVLTYFPYAT